jgi:succinyl-CoA synthetase beta subunit
MPVLNIRREGTNADLSKNIICVSGLNFIRADGLNDAPKMIFRALKVAR